MSFPIIGAATVQQPLPSPSPFQPSKPPIEPGMNWGTFAICAATSVGLSVLGSYVNGKIAQSANADSVAAGMKRSTSFVEATAKAAAAAETNRVLHSELKDKLAVLTEDHAQRLTKLEVRQEALERTALWIINAVPGLKEQYAAAAEAPQS